jgi:molecular chaperone GrpE
MSDKKNLKKKKKTPDKKKLQAQEYLEGWQRAKADFENYKKEEDRRFQELTQRLKADFILQLLPVIDNFEEAFKHLSDQDKKADWLQGILKIKEQLEKILKDDNVEEIAAKGKDFDPNFHEAVGEAKSEAKHRDKVIKVLQKGYKMGDDVIRPAKVYVGK